MTSSSTRRALSVVTVLALVLSVFGLVRPAAAVAGDTFFINDVTQFEGNTGTTTFVFTVTREGPGTAVGGATLTYVVNDGGGGGVPANAGSDYVDEAGTITFAAGETSKTIDVVVNGDTTVEPDETFSIVLTEGTLEAGDCSDCTGIGTIRTDETQANVSNAVTTEGGNAVFAITVAPTSTSTVTVDYTTEDSSAKAGVDYTTTAGTVTFAPGETSKTVSVPTLGDTIDEPQETFVLKLTGATNATLGDATGTGQINDDDAAPTISVSDATGTEAGPTAATFTVSLSGASGQEVTVGYTTANGTASSPDDYTTQSGTLTFAVGETSKSVAVPVVDDSVDEPSETFSFTLSAPVNATIADGTGAGSITDNDGPPSVAVSDAPPVDEGNSGTTNARFTIALNTPSGQPVDVAYATEDGSAVAGQDYTATSGTVTFAPGETTKTVDVPVLGDTTTEADETFALTITSAPLATIADDEGVATITNDDAQPKINITDVTVTEADTGATTAATVTVSLDRASSASVTVGYTTTEKTATDPEDYTASNGTITFAPGETSKTVTISVAGDNLDEATETFEVTLSAPTNASINDAIGVVTITDNDPGPTISIADAQTVEGPSGDTTQLTFNLTLSAPSGQTVTVNWATANGTATAPGDYVAATGTASFAPGLTTTAITVTVKGDNIAEADETLLVTLSDPANATIADGEDEATGTILDDDEGTPSTLSIADATITETDGSQTLNFTVSLAPSSSETVRVDVAAVAGTASAGSDFSATPTTLVFSPGQTSKTYAVTIAGDNVYEGTETFEVILSNPENATITDDTGVGTITDDETTPTISIADNSPVNEGDTGTVNTTFTVSLSGASQHTITVNFATSDDTAKAGSDYTTNAGKLTFEPGEVEKTVTVVVVGDRRHEGTETFNVTLSSPTNATLGDAQGVGTILDDESDPAITIADAQLTEGDTGSSAMQFTLTLSLESDKTVTVNYATAPGAGPNAATAGTDYSTATGTVTFNPGQTTKVVSVPIIGDNVDEPNETFVVNLTSPTNATIGDAQATGTILDDDSSPTFSINDVTVTEGNTGTVDATFTVTLSGPSSTEQSVTATTDNGTATAPSDFTAGTATLTFAAGDTSETFTVSVKADEVDEANETFSVVLSNPSSGASIHDGTGVGTITDDDAAPTLTINDSTVTEGNGGTVDATFTVTKSGATERVVTVDFATSNGTATAGSDYTAASGPLTFAAGETTKTITVTVAGDTVDEANETYTVALSNATNATITDATGAGTITDDDGAPALSINDVAVAEGNSGTTNAAFTVTLAPASGRSVTVNYATSNGTATAGTDYTAASGTVTFAAGETTKAITVAVIGDTADEANEAFNVTLSGASNATISDGTGVGTITDDDEAADTDPEQRYVLAGADGRVYAFNTTHRGDMAGQRLNQPIIGLTMTPSGNGYWLVAKDGGIFTFGDAEFFGSMGGERLNQPVLGMEATPTGKGYWLFAADGGIFTFGDAKFHGSTGNMRLNAPVIGMETTGDGSGYWLVAQDGGIFTFNAPFHGSTGNMKLNQPVFDMAALDNGAGYWLVARDGGIFTFGNAEFKGSAVGQTTSTVIGMRDTPSGNGYWIADATGKVMVFGDADYLGDNRTTSMTAPIVGFAAVEA